MNKTEQESLQKNIIITVKKLIHHIEDVGHHNESVSHLQKELDRLEQGFKKVGLFDTPHAALLYEAQALIYYFSDDPNDQHLAVRFTQDAQHVGSSYYLYSDTINQGLREVAKSERGQNETVKLLKMIPGIIPLVLILNAITFGITKLAGWDIGFMTLLVFTYPLIFGLAWIGDGER